MQERIIQLENLAALQDQTISELNKEVFRQQQDISRLQRRIEIIDKKLTDLKEPDEIGGNERPPHY